MDVRDLAPALLSIGQLCERTNDILNDGRAEISVKVRSDFKTGSFELQLEVTQTIIEAAKYIFSHKDQVTTAKELLEIIGLVSAGMTASLLAFIKWLRGRKATKTVALESGNIRIFVDNSIQFIDVKPQVVDLYNDDEVRKAALGIVKPLESEGIDSLAVKDGLETFEIIKLEDLPAFNSLSKASPDELLLEGERKAALTIIKPSFDDDLKWVFSEGEARFSASLQDERFLQKLANREISFTKGDILVVRLFSKSYRTSTGLRTEHKVLEVTDIKPAPRQISLLPPLSTE